jgi:hypothetical protein
MKFQRDIDYDGSKSSFAFWDDNDNLSVNNIKEKIKEKHRFSFLRRTIENGTYTYQVGYRNFLLRFIPIGDKHLFKYQAWKSAYYNIKNGK